ncbi:J domain-containing protein [Sphingobacterium thermophilum]|uniref:J domain-containing protein n=1 Tax=Sphingobacterium thermophilum TaxID=768534 RepID=UPI0031EAC386
MTTKEAKNILDLEDYFTIEQLKSSYRDLLKKNHPDKQAHMFSDIAAANEKTAKIVEAYRILLQEKKYFTKQAQGANHKSYDSDFPHKTSESSQSKSKKKREAQRDLYEDFIGKYKIPTNDKDFPEMNWAVSFIIKILILYPIIITGNIYRATIGRINSKFLRKTLLFLFVVATAKLLYEKGMVIFMTIFACYFILASSLQGLTIFRILLEGIGKLFKPNFKISPNGGLQGSLLYLSLYYFLIAVSSWIFSIMLKIHEPFTVFRLDLDHAFLNGFILYYIVLFIILVVETSAFVKIRRYMRSTMANLYEIEKIES